VAFATMGHCAAPALGRAAPGNARGGARPGGCARAV